MFKLDGSFAGINAAQWQTLGAIAAVIAGCGGLAMLIVRVIARYRRRERRLVLSLQAGFDKRAAEIEAIRLASETRQRHEQAAEAMARRRGDRGVHAMFEEYRKDPDWGFDD